MRLLIAGSTSLPELPKKRGAPSEEGCLMGAQRDPYGEIAWRKSSASANGDACIEVAVRESLVLVRDSRSRHGGMLEIPAERWREFLEFIDAASGRQSVAGRPGR